MAKKMDKGALAILAVILVAITFQMGGAPFLGALVLFEEGNEIIFRGEQTEVTKQIDNTTGLNITTDLPAITTVERQLTLQSKYVTDAKIRMLGTPELNNISFHIAYNVVEIINNETITSTIHEGIWDQSEPFTEVIELDLTTPLNGKKEGDVIRFIFHSHVPGSLAITNFNVEWGPTQAQINLCENTEGTFNEPSLSCVCPSDSIGFAWENGCEFEQEVTGTSDGGYSGVADISAPSPVPTTTLEAVRKTPSFTDILIIVVIILVIAYIKFEKGPKGLFKGI